MFTGIIIATGSVASIIAKAGDLELGVDAPRLDFGRIGLGDSISVQGACLTVTRKEATRFYADVSRETMSKTTLGTLLPGARVNLELSLRAGDALGGHLVSGHVDGVGKLIAAKEDARSWRLEFAVPAELTRFVAPKGSICINGVSLTINGATERHFDVNIIPHTRQETTLGDLRAGDDVNIEIDVIARYLDRLIAPQKK